MALGERLRQFRELANLSQNELAKRANIPRPIISMVESGKQKSMSLENARRIARVLGVTLDLLAGAGAEMPMKSDMTLSVTKIEAPSPYYIVQYGVNEVSPTGSIEGSYTISSKEKLKDFLNEWKITADDSKNSFDVVLRMVDPTQVMQSLEKHRM